MNLRLLSCFLICLFLLSPEVTANKWGENYKVKKIRQNSKNKALNKSKKKQAVYYIVDSFSDASYLQKPEWWRFGNLYLSIEANKKKAKYLGKNALRIQGVTDKWYVGGCGSYLGIDAEPYKLIKLVIYSPKANNALLKIELYDDDK